MYFKLPGEELEDGGGMVTLVVAIDRELLRRVNASLHPDLAAEGIASV